MNPMQPHPIFVSDRNNALNTLAYELASMATNNSLFGTTIERVIAKDRPSQQQNNNAQSRQRNNSANNRK
jgi:hypothetical protein